MARLSKHITLDGVETRLQRLPTLRLVARKHVPRAKFPETFVTLLVLEI